MYPIADTVKELFLNDNRQVINIELTPTVGDVVTITEGNIVGGSFVFDRTCVGTDSLTLGSCMASEVEFELFNTDGEFSSVVFEGAEMFIQLGVYDPDSDSNYFFPIGYYTIDSIPKKRDTIHIYALDRMVQFDRTADVNTLTSWWGGALDVQTLINNLCQTCDIHLATDISSYPNASYVIPNMPETENLTYRQLLIWACALMGKCGYIDWDGALRIEFPSKNVVVYNNGKLTIVSSQIDNSYADGTVRLESSAITQSYANNKLTLNIEDVTTPVGVLDETKRFSSDIEDFIITYTGVVFDDFFYGSEDYAFNLSGNLLCQDPTILTNLDVIGLSYTPFEASTLAYPWLYPMDYINVTRGSTISVMSLLTNITFRMNGSCELASKGVSGTEKSYATLNPLTATEQAVINKAINTVGTNLNSRLEEVTRVNQLIANSFGLYYTVVEQSNGSIKVYMHDRPTLEDSKKVFTMNDGAFAWTDDYNGDQTVWSASIDYAGNAMFRLISAIGLDLSDVNNEYHTEVLPNSFSIKKGDTLVMQIYAGASGDYETQMAIPKLIVDDPSTPDVDGYIEIGRCRLSAVANGMSIIYID